MTPITLWLVVTSLNPVVWIYAGRSMPDTLSVGLVCVAFLIAVYAKGRIAMHAAAALVFSSAILIKFNAAPLGIGFLYLIFRLRQPVPSGRNRMNQLACYLFIPLMIVGGYLWMVYAKFGFFLIHENLRTISFEGQNIFRNLSWYLSFISIFSGLLCVAILMRFWADHRRKIWIVFIILSLCLAVYPTIRYPIIDSISNGELNLGLLDYFLSGRAISFFHMFGLITTLLFLFMMTRDAIWHKCSYSGFLLCLVVGFIAFYSFFRPAQRYLLYLVPFVLYYFTVIMAKRSRKLVLTLGGVTAIFFMFVTSGSVLYQIAQGTAADRMMRWVTANGFRELTEVESEIYHHAGHYYTGIQAQKTEYLLTIREDPKKHYLRKEEVKVLNKHIRTYYFYEK